MLHVLMHLRLHRVELLLLVVGQDVADFGVSLVVNAPGLVLPVSAR